MNTEFQIKLNKTSVVYIATLSNLNGNRVEVSLEGDPIGPKCCITGRQVTSQTSETILLI